MTKSVAQAAYEIADEAYAKHRSERHAHSKYMMWTNCRDCDRMIAEMVQCAGDVHDYAKDWTWV